MDKGIQKQSDENNVIPHKASSKDTFEDISSDDEVQRDLAIDPFKHRLNMTKEEWARTYILTVLLIPIRVVLIFVTLLLIQVCNEVLLTYVRPRL